MYDDGDLCSGLSMANFHYSNMVCYTTCEDKIFCSTVNFNSSKMDAVLGDADGDGEEGENEIVDPFLPESVQQGQNMAHYYGYIEGTGSLGESVSSEIYSSGKWYPVLAAVSDGVAVLCTVPTEQDVSATCAIVYQDGHLVSLGDEVDINDGPGTDYLVLSVDQPSRTAVVCFESDIDETDESKCTFMTIGDGNLLTADEPIAFLQGDTEDEIGVTALDADTALVCYLDDTSEETVGKCRIVKRDGTLGETFTYHYNNAAYTTVAKIDSTTAVLCFEFEVEDADENMKCAVLKVDGMSITSGEALNVVSDDEAEHISIAVITEYEIRVCYDNDNNPRGLQAQCVTLIRGGPDGTRLQLATYGATGYEGEPYVLTFNDDVDTIAIKHMSNGNTMVCFENDDEVDCEVHSRMTYRCALENAISEEGEEGEGEGFITRG